MPNIINCNLIPPSRFHLRDIFIVIIQSSYGIKKAPESRKQRDHVCAIEYYWVDIGHNLYALVSEE